MENRRGNILLILIFIGILSQAYSQINKIEVIARAQEDEILLRWAPTNFASWHYLNQHGYTIERYTVTKDSVLLSPPIRIALVPYPIKPKPLEEWETLAEKNDYAAVAAQVIYGESIELTVNDGADIAQIVHKTKEQDQRYSFALFSADQSFEVAEAAGLGFADLNSVKGEKYLYKIISNVPDSIDHIEEGTVFIGLEDHVHLPKPIDVEGEFGDRSVILRWNRSFFERTYNSFIVERSDDDGATFSASSSKSLINTYKGDTPDADSYYKLDSLPENGKTYYYRIKGKTSFGETGPPSDVIKGMGKVPFRVEIGIISDDITDEKVTVNWDVRSDEIEAISHFSLERSNTSNGPFKSINSQDIDRESRSYTDLLPRATNYYRITAFDKYRNTKKSFPYLVQLQDSIPPAVPVNLTGIVDSTGIVNVSWQPNTEGDLLGYRVYRSNFKNAEFGQVTTEPVLEANFTDSISINTLTSSIYYKVLAIDHRFNPSELSEAVALKRPDIIPPVPPVFKSIKSVDEGIAIEWINSSSTDVAAHIIYKNKTGESGWNIYRTIQTDTIKSLIDDEVEPGVYYNYTMIAVDSSKLESLPANAIRGIKVDAGIRKSLENVKADVNRTTKSIAIQWEYNSQNVKEFLLYKREAENTLSLYASIPGNNVEFVDRSLVVNTSYVYRLKAIYNDGSESPFSNEIKVKY